ncbi:MAG: T9SS type A sorting domain-containing protein, partial [Bacteroidota bacterium]
KDAELASLKSERFNLYNNLLTCYMIDTSLTAHDSLIAILAAEQTPESKYLLASVQLDDRDTISMNATLASIPSSYNLTTEQQALHEDYISYFALRLRMIDDTLYNSQPDSSQIVALFAMLEQSKEPVNVYARNLLIANNVISYSELYLFPDELKSSRARKHHNMATMKTATMMQVFPNPAINYIIVVYNLNNLPHDDIIDATLEINSMQGSILKQIILKRKEDQIVLPTSNLRPGNYVVLLKVDGKLIESRKLTILSD